MGFYYMLMQPSIWISKSHHGLRDKESDWLSMGVQEVFQIVFKKEQTHPTENFCVDYRLKLPILSPLLLLYVLLLSASVSFPSRANVFIHVLATQSPLPF